MKNKGVPVQLIKAVVGLFLALQTNLSVGFAADVQTKSIEFLTTDNPLLFQGITANAALVLTGDTEQSVLVQAGNCAPSGLSFPVQTAIVIDPGAASHGEKMQIIPLNDVPFTSYFSNRIQPGTRLTNIVFLSNCDFNGVNYVKWRATIELVQALVFVTPCCSGLFPGPDGDVIVFTGKPLGMTSAGNCAPGDRPLHKAIVLDSQGEWEDDFVQIIPISQTTPVKPGTRLKNLRPIGTCDGGAYDKFVGEVE